MFSNAFYFSCALSCFMSVALGGEINASVVDLSLRWAVALAVTTTTEIRMRAYALTPHLRKTKENSLTSGAAVFLRLFGFLVVPRSLCRKEAAASEVEPARHNQKTTLLPLFRCAAFAQFTFQCTMHDAQFIPYSLSPKRAL